MGDLIDRDEAIIAVKVGALSAATLYGRTDEGSTALYETVRAIKAIPSAQPQRIKGIWERKESEMSWWYECSECGESPLYNPYADEVLTSFCPWCGAEMEVE